VEDNGYHLRIDNTGQDTTTCGFQGESVARLGALMKQPRRLARPFFAAGGMMAARSDSKTSRHYLDGLPQTHLPAFGLRPIH
jgi:hypothetical protein